MSIGRAAWPSGDEVTCGITTQDFHWVCLCKALISSAGLWPGGDNMGKLPTFSKVSWMCWSTSTNTWGSLRFDSSLKGKRFKPWAFPVLLGRKGRKCLGQIQSLKDVKPGHGPWSFFTAKTNRLKLDTVCSNLEQPILFSSSDYCGWNLLCAFSSLAFHFLTWRNLCKCRLLCVMFTCRCLWWAPRWCFLLPCSLSGGAWHEAQICSCPGWCLCPSVPHHGRPWCWAAASLQCPRAWAGRFLLVPLPHLVILSTLSSFCQSLLLSPNSAEIWGF